MMTGRDLKYIRFRHSMTQEYVASIVGISRFTLSSYEAGRTGIPITVSLKLNKLYNLDEDDVERYMTK
ncbi:MAG: helix-turn-helix transcriptional regulator [Clostridia bacterium]|nr:helix-turn-helix transcriptional regulator [Clostridia bacterium]